MPLVHSLARPGWRPISLVTILASLTFFALVPGSDARPKHGPNAPIDATAPETTITSGPSGTITTSSASLGFSSSEGGSSFQCQLDSGGYGGCSSARSLSGLADGPHTFAVRAVDRAGNVDATPATRSFAVDTDTSSTPPPTGGAVPTSWSRFASFESTLNYGTDFGWRVDSPFSVTRTSDGGGSDGSYAAKIVTNGGNSSCSCPRMTYQDGFSFGPGDELWIGGSWLVTDPSKLAWSRLMNLGHYESDSDNSWMLGLVIRESGMSVQARSYHSDDGVSILMPARSIPDDRWFRVDLHLKLAATDGQAQTDVYVDGQLVSSSTKRNMWAPTPLTFYNAGLPYFWPGNGNTTVYFDAPRLTPGS